MVYLHYPIRNSQILISNLFFKQNLCMFYVTLNGMQKTCGYAFQSFFVAMLYKIFFSGLGLIRIIFTFFKNLTFPLI